MGAGGAPRLRIYNTLSREVEDFQPIEPPSVKMYVCGPTVQDYAHLGHAKTYIVFDVLYRLLTFLGYRVKYARNITDVGHLREDTQEDRIVAGAARERLDPMELVDKYMFAFFRDMDRLNIRRPTVQPRATMHIVDMWEAIDRLLKKGHAYLVDGNIYFDVSSYEHYGQLSKIKKEELVRHRVEPAPGKRNPADFALWKRAERGYLLKWNSPWGEGFPGWHIECSIMSIKHLGEQIDIHGGGQDLIFPHHENEIAQSECITGKRPFARYWVHVGYLTVRGEKMSKSLGNFITIDEALKDYTPNDLRLFILSSHYRSPLDYSEGAMSQVAAVRERIEETYRRVLEAQEYAAESGEPDNSYLEAIGRSYGRILESLCSDLNTPETISNLIELTRQVNAHLDKTRTPRRAEITTTLSLLSNIFEVLGLIAPETRVEVERLHQVIQRLLAARESLRRQGNYAAADLIRTALKEAGVEVEDTAQGPRYRLSR